jgi:hypothetical protein
MSSAKSVSYAVTPASSSAELSSISAVVIDLIFTTSKDSVAFTRSTTDPLRVGSVECPVHVATRRHDIRFEFN